MIWKKKTCNIFCNSDCTRDSENWGLRVKISHFEHNQMAEAYQESTEHVEADEVDNGKATATGPLLSRVVIWLWIAQLAWHAGQHDLLPGLACSTPNSERGTTSIQLQPYIKKKDALSIMTYKYILTWTASRQLGERFESCCCGWFVSHLPLLFSQTPKKEKKYPINA